MSNMEDILIFNATVDALWADIKPGGHTIKEIRQLSAQRIAEAGGNSKDHHLIEEVITYAIKRRRKSPRDLEIAVALRRISASGRCPRPSNPFISLDGKMLRNYEKIDVVSVRRTN